jgi:hypothetical protein
MQVTVLRDKLDIGLKCRLDDLSIKELTWIQSLIKEDLERKEEFLKTYTDKNIDIRKLVIDGENEFIKDYKSMLSDIKNKTHINLKCYNYEVSNESFESLNKRYKKFKLK